MERCPFVRQRRCQTLAILRRSFKFQYRPTLLASEPDLLAVAYRSPVAIVCCRSAAAVHELSDELPPRCRSPYPPDTAHRGSPIHRQRYFGSLPILSRLGYRSWRRRRRVGADCTPGRTVVDLMRLRHRFGESLALAALQRYCADGMRHQRSWCAWPRCPMWRARYAVRSTWPLRNDPPDAQYRGPARLPGSAAPCPFRGPSCPGVAYPLPGRAVAGAIGGLAIRRAVRAQTRLPELVSTRIREFVA